MEEEKKKTKEYYQVNLDTGRIFWIVFVMGIIVIGIFFFGLYLGGDKEREKLFSFDRSKLLKREIVRDLAQEKLNEESHILKILGEDLEEESRYIEIEGIQAPGKEVEEMPEVVVQAEKPAVDTQKTTTDTPRVQPIKKETVAVKKTTPAPKTTYVAKGNYYIQVASFIKEANANVLAEDLKKRLYKVVIEEATLDEKTFYRVRVGPFITEGIATNTMISMRRQFNLKDPFVVKKRS
jgi:cell division protein FtsN